MSDLSSMELYIAICKEMGLDLHAKKPEPIYKYYCYRNGVVRIADFLSDTIDCLLKERFLYNKDEIENWDYNRRVLINKAHEEWKDRIRNHYELTRPVFDAYYKPICTIIGFDINSSASQAKLCTSLKILLDSVKELVNGRGVK